MTLSLAHHNEAVRRQHEGLCEPDLSGTNKSPDEADRWMSAFLARSVAYQLRHRDDLSDADRQRMRDFVKRMNERKHNGGT